MKRRLVPIAFLTLAVALGGATSQAAEPSDDAKPSVTVFPVVASPDTLSEEFAKRVGIVVATFLERAGDWVLIEMQNSHHADFQRIDPKSAADCGRLVVARLKDWLSD